MDKKRRVIAKGTPRNRYLVPIDWKDRKRIIYYDSKGVAEARFKSYGFYGNYDPEKKKEDGTRGEYDLEVVEVEIIIKKK